MQKVLLGKKQDSLIRYRAVFRRNKMKKIVLGLIAATLSTSANAAAYSGADLLGQCKNFVEIINGTRVDLKQSLDAGLCGGYVLGVQEGFIASSRLSNIASEDVGTAPVAVKYWDVPEDVEAEKIVQIVVKYLEINPEMQQQPAVLSVINALRQTYPAGK